MLKDVDFFGSASSFVTIAEKIAFRNERNKVWIFCSTGRASNDSLGGFRFVFSFVAVLTDRVVHSDYSSHLFWNREKTSKIKDEVGSLRDPSQRLEGREGPVRRHSAYFNRQLGNILKIVLWTHKQVAEEHGRKNVAGFKLHKRMVEIGPENWKIVALEGARSSDEAMELVKATCEFLDADLNEWVRER